MAGQQVRLTSGQALGVQQRAVFPGVKEGTARGNAPDTTVPTVDSAGFLDNLFGLATGALDRAGRLYNAVVNFGEPITPEQGGPRVRAGYSTGVDRTGNPTYTTAAETRVAEDTLIDGIPNVVLAVGAGLIAIAVLTRKR